MNFPDTRAVLAALLLLLVAAPVCPTHEHTSQDTVMPQEELSPAAQEKLREALTSALANFNDIYIPSLPPISVPGESVSISMSLADIYLKGLTDNKFSWKPLTGLQQKAHATLLFNKITLLVGTYSSTGHLLNLPLNGEGLMYLRLYDLKIDLSIDWYFYNKTICAKYNSTGLDLSLKRMETHFDNLNTLEGNDLGQLVDIVLPSFGSDIIERLEDILSTKYYQLLNGNLIEFINSKTGCNVDNSGSILEAEDIMKIISDVIHDFLH